jgi:ATP-dependent protease ClpP protease subunit
MSPQARTISEKKFRVQFLNNASGVAEVSVDIFDALDDWWGWGVDRLARAMYGHTGPIRVRVNSYGGDLMQGLAIMNLLKSHPSDVTVEVMGVAASAATFIVAGADKAIMREGSFLMVHNPFTYAVGDAQDMEQSGAALRKVEEEMANVYLSAIRKRKKYEEMDDAALLNQVRAWMDAETWFTSSEAVANGFADSVEGIDSDSDEPIQAAANSFQHFATYRNTPQRVLNLISAHTKTTDTMSKEQTPSLLDQIKALLNPPKAEEQPAEQTEQADPVEAAKKLLEDAGFTVGKTEETPAENKADAPKGYTEDEVKALVQQAIAAQNAKAEAAKNPTAPKPGASATSKADALRSKAAPAFEALAKMVQGK